MKTGLSANQIKIIAILAMTIDHIAWFFFAGYDKVWWVILMHVIGRLTAPIMWFFLAEGFHYTKNRRAYIIRLFLFSVVSHFAYIFVTGKPVLPKAFFLSGATSVMWTLTCGGILITIYEMKNAKKWSKIILISLVCILTFPSDWAVIGAVCPLLLYIYRGDFQKQSIMMVECMVINTGVYYALSDKTYAIIQLCVLLSLPILRLYNGKKSNDTSVKKAANRYTKWFFYLYYPIHLFIIGIIKTAIK